MGLLSFMAKHGDPVEQREAERLLQEVRETAEEGEAKAFVALPGGNGGGYVPEEEVAAEVEEEQAQQRGLSRFLIPLIFLIVIMVNVVARLTGED